MMKDTPIPVADAALVSRDSVKLSDSARTLAGASLSPATLRAYRAALASLDAWLIAEGRGKSDEAIADYLATRFDGGASPATLGQVVAAVKCALSKLHSQYQIECTIIRKKGLA